MILLYDTMHYEGTYIVSYTSIICMILVYDTPHYKAGHSGGITAGIMHSEIRVHDLSGCAMIWPLIELRVEFTPLLVSYMSGPILL